MRIQRLEIENFRGIKSLNWTLPSVQQLLVLVGPGDSGKTTILDSIHLLLGDRWNVGFSDTDFFSLDLSSPIRIKGILVDLPQSMRREDTFGLWLSGIDQVGEVHQDPEDEFAPALIVCLTVDSNLEPKWTVERVDGQLQQISAAQRRSFSTFKVDERDETQLRWTRTSALGRLSQDSNSQREALALASRAAREALANHSSDPLAEVAQKVQETANAVGGGSFTDIRPGLDTTRSSMGAGLALYENVVPLAAFGQGSRRLASFAVQQLAAGSRAIAVVDEIESGLEPHRAIRLLRHLLTDNRYSQVIVTTHSPVIVEQAKIENLASVQSDEGHVVVTSLGAASQELQRVRRSRPSSLLARRVLITEGKTEYGLLSAFLESLDDNRVACGLSTTAGEGIALQHGEGGSEVPLRAMALKGLGFATCGFLDNDARDVDEAAKSASDAGVVIIRWERDHCTESQVCSRLDENGLSAFLKLATSVRHAEETVLQDLNSANPARIVSTLVVSDWLTAGESLEGARARVVDAAKNRKWFKEIEAGRLLGEWILKYRERPELLPIIERLDQVAGFVFPQVHLTAEAGSTS